MKWTRAEFLFLCSLIKQHGATPEHTPVEVVFEHQKHYKRTTGAIHAKIKDYVWGPKQHKWQNLGDRREW